MTLATCPHGHTYTADNTARDTKGARYCLTCKRAAGRTPRKRLRPLAAFSLHPDVIAKLREVAGASGASRFVERLLRRALKMPTAKE